MASTRASIAPEATSWREQADMTMPGSVRTSRCSRLLDISSTSPTVAPSSRGSPFAPCGCSAAFSLAQFATIVRGSIVLGSPAGRMAKRR